MPDLYAPLASLPLVVSSYSFEPREQATAGGWRRLSTIVRLAGEGHEGKGEDVCFGEVEQRALQAGVRDLPLAGRLYLGEFTQILGDLDLFSTPPEIPDYRSYRRWAFEAAALDLALRQAGASLADLLGRTPRPVRFVVSLGLGDPPSLDAIERVLALYPGTQFKVDYSASWTRGFIERLARLGVVAAVDLKGQYHGAFEGPAADADRYKWIAELFPEAWIEDPHIDAKTLEALGSARGRISWDAVVHSPRDISDLPLRPGAINIKPSRFGSLRALLAAYHHCEAEGIAMYGGGQYELGPGREQIQCLASLFHPGAPNDVAPAGYNQVPLPPGLPSSPLPAGRSGSPGFPPRQASGPTEIEG